MIMKKITVKYLESGFQYKTSRSKNSLVISKSITPKDLNAPTVENDSAYIRLKTNKYSVIFNKLSGKTEISQYLNEFSKQSAKKSRLVKEMILTSDDMELLQKDFSALESLYI
jgi:hypothetical protein